MPEAQVERELCMCVHVWAGQKNQAVYAMHAWRVIDFFTFFTCGVCVCVCVCVQHLSRSPSAVAMRVASQLSIDNNSPGLDPHARSQVTHSGFFIRVLVVLLGY